MSVVFCARNTLVSGCLGFISTGAAHGLACTVFGASPGIECREPQRHHCICIPCHAHLLNLLVLLFGKTLWHAAVSMLPQHCDGSISAIPTPQYAALAWSWGCYTCCSGASGHVQQSLIICNGRDCQVWSAAAQTAHHIRPASQHGMPLQIW